MTGSTQLDGRVLSEPRSTRAGLDGTDGTDGTHGTDALDPAAATVLAAGVLCWRPAADSLEVLLVHRPRYHDWSFPKGKLEPGELLPECAVRELAEETGVTAVLGRPLPGTRYTAPTGEPKEVSYWAGRPVRARRRTAKAAEVDDARWVLLDSARQLLTATGDRVPLDALATLWAAGELITTPILVVRHASARPRDAWPRADAERPLVASGRRQAVALAALLRCWQPQRLLSSPWRRCLETLAPYAAASGARLRTKGGLTESGYRRDGGKARRHTAAMIAKDRPAAVCTHRPVLEGVLAAVRAAATKEVRAQVPDRQPFLAPGEVLVAHVLHGRAGAAHVVAVERHLAPR